MIERKFEFVFEKGQETSNDGLNDFFVTLGKFTKLTNDGLGNRDHNEMRVATKKFKITIETVK